MRKKLTPFQIDKRFSEACKKGLDTSLSGALYVCTY